MLRAKVERLAPAAEGSGRCECSVDAAGIYCGRSIHHPGGSRRNVIHADGHGNGLCFAVHAGSAAGRTVCHHAHILGELQLERLRLWRGAWRDGSWRATLVHSRRCHTIDRAVLPEQRLVSSRRLSLEVEVAKENSIAQL